MIPKRELAMSVSKILLRIKHAIVGKPLTHQEVHSAEVSQRSGYQGDARHQAQMEVRNARFPQTGMF